MKQNNIEIKKIIESLAFKYIHDYDKQPLYNGGIMKCSSPYDINNGLCADFAIDVLKTTEYFINPSTRTDIYELSSDMFVTDDIKFAQDEWGKIIFKNELAWSIKMLNLYGHPPTFIDIPLHVWIFYKKKHYDAECPSGVKFWFELPIFMRLYQISIETNNP